MLGNCGGLGIWRGRKGFGSIGVSCMVLMMLMIGVVVVVVLLFRGVWCLIEGLEGRFDSFGGGVGGGAFGELRMGVGVAVLD